MRTACSPSIGSPVSSISIAALRETLRDRATMGVEQNSPISTPGVAKRAEVEATARSQLATSWQPAAVAMPWTWAITGLGWRTIVCMSVEHCLKSDSKNALPLSASFLRAVIRSEEHTSELQSQFHLVCRLLPEKKTKNA